MMSAAPEISVVIPTCGRADTLRDVLGSLFHQTFDPEKVEICVILDGEAPQAAAVVAEQADRATRPVLTIRQPRSGQGIARNHGIRRATGRIILMLDDDIVCVPDLLSQHARHHEGRDDRVVTGALPVEKLDLEPAHQRDLRRWWDGEMEERASPHHQPSFRDFATGNVSVPRSRLVEVGGFDADFTGYGREDYELGYRLLRAGLHFVHEPRAIGLHRYRKAPIEWLRQWAAMGRADVIFVRKHPEITAEIMSLSLFPHVPWNSAAVAAAERVVLRLNTRGGKVWRRVAAFAMAAHYWRGVREAARDSVEFRSLVQLRTEIRRSGRGNKGIAKRILNMRRRFGL